MDRWKSIGLYEHPAKHQVGTFGNVILSTAGVYALRVGSSIMSCPQSWASKIHREESMDKENLSIRGINRGLWSHFKAKCAILGIPVGQRINQLLMSDLNNEPRIEDIIQAVKEG